MEKNVILFLTNGRCGTQWLYSLLKDNYPDAHIEHEAILSGYRSGNYIENPYKIVELDAVKEHIKNVKQIVKKKDYIEIGWPIYSALPTFIEMFDNVKIVHLIRHPVDSALSHVSHSLFRSDIVRNEYTEQCLPKYLKKQEKHPYDKCLDVWYFIHHTWKQYIKKLYPDIEIEFFRAEDLFNGSDFERFINYMGLQYKEDLHKYKKVDESSRYLHGNINWKTIFNYDNILDVAKQYGYDINRDDKPSKLYKPIKNKIVVGVPCSSHVHHKFTVALTSSCVELMNKGYPIDVSYKEGSLIPKQRNFLAQLCLHKGNNLFFVDSDMIFKTDDMLKLIDADKDIIAGIGRSRRPPYHYCAFYEFKDDKDAFVNYIDNNLPKELFKCDAVGSSFLYIKHHVLKEMYSYEFVKKYGHPFDLWQQEDGGQLGEDMSFCVRARKAGFDVWVDPTIDLGHIGENILWTGGNDHAKKSDI